MEYGAAMERGPILTITSSAMERIAGILAAEMEPDAVFRIRVEGGGCKGFRYRLHADERKAEDDVEIGDTRVVVDEASAPFLVGATLDWVTGLLGEHLDISNPNAAASCGCGNSFS